MKLLPCISGALGRRRDPGVCEGVAEETRWASWITAWRRALAIARKSAACSVQLRGPLSLRDVTRSVGVSSSYLSQIERGERRPGPNLIKKLATLFNVDPYGLMKQAGLAGQPDPAADEASEVERAYQYVLADPAFRVGTRPDGPLSDQCQALHRRDVRAVHGQEAAPDGEDA